MEHGDHDGWGVGEPHWADHDGSSPDEPDMGELDGGPSAGGLPGHPDVPGIDDESPEADPFGGDVSDDAAPLPPELDLSFGAVSDGDDPAPDQAWDGNEHTDLDEAYPTAVDPVVGVTPELDVVGDDPAWDAQDLFPPPLETEVPEPVDGFPWSDAAALGDPDADSGSDYGVRASDGVPPPMELFGYDAQHAPAAGAGWQALAHSDDPATSSLARWWGTDS